MWPWNLTDDRRQNRAPLLCHCKFCALFRSHLWIKTGVEVWKHSSHNRQVFGMCVLETGRMILKIKSRTPLSHHFKLCASFYSHLWIQNGVWKPPNLAKIGFDRCDLDLSPLTFCSDIAIANGNNYWGFHDDIMENMWWTDKGTVIAAANTAGTGDTLTNQVGVTQICASKLSIICMYKNLWI